MEDFDLQNKNVSIANLGITERIRLISSGDANKNAIICLDNFASLLSMDLQDNFAESRVFLGM
jgi:hypothetical protein